MDFKKFVRHYRPTLKLAIPVIISQAGQAFTGIMDNAMIGNVDTLSLAASAFSLSIFTIFMIFGMGFTFGLTPLVGNAFGENNLTRIGNLFRHSLVLNILLATILFFILQGLTQVMHLMDQPQDVVEHAMPYYQVINLSLFPLVLFFTFKQFAEGVESTQPAMVFTLLGNVLNIILNYILIYGKLGFPELGLVGAGIATLISRIFMAVGMIIYIFRTPKFKKYLTEFAHFQFKKELFQKIFKLSMPIGLQFILEVAAFAIGTIMVGRIGKTEMAAHQISLGLASLTFMMSSGVSTAVMIRVSSMYGKKAYQEMREIAYAGLHMVIGFMTVCAVIFVIGKQFLPNLHTDDWEVIKVASTLMIIAAFFQLFDGIQVVGASALRGISDVKIPTWMAFFSHWVVSLPIGYVMTFVVGVGEIGVWIGFLAGLTVASVMYIVRFEFISKKIIVGSQM